MSTRITIAIAFTYPEEGVEVIIHLYREMYDHQVYLEVDRSGTGPVDMTVCVSPLLVDALAAVITGAGMDADDARSAAVDVFMKERRRAGDMALEAGRKRVAATHPAWLRE